MCTWAANMSVLNDEPQSKMEYYTFSLTSKCAMNWTEDLGIRKLRPSLQNCVHTSVSITFVHNHNLSLHSMFFLLVQLSCFVVLFFHSQDWCIFPYLVCKSHDEPHSMEGCWYMPFSQCKFNCKTIKSINIWSAKSIHFNWHESDALSRLCIHVISMRCPQDGRVISV